MANHKGAKKVGGRKKGTLNKSTASAKAAMEEAFVKMGGVESLKKWGNENPTEFYRLWSKLIPSDIKAELSGVLNARVTYKPLVKRLDGSIDNEDI